MTYFKDGSDYQYFSYFEYPNTVNVGWLAAGEVFKKAEPSSDVLEVLREFCTISMAQSRGGHYCDLCESDELQYLHLESGAKILLGTSEIRVFGDQKIYAAPTLIYHYVEKHHYAPTDDFIDALLNGPQPRSREYVALLDGIDQDWYDRRRQQYKTFKDHLFGFREGLLHDTLAQIKTILDTALKPHNNYFYGVECHIGTHDNIKLELINNIVRGNGKRIEPEFPEGALLLYVRGEDVSVDRISQLLPQHGWMPLKSWSVKHDR